MGDPPRRRNACAHLDDGAADGHTTRKPLTTFRSGSGLDTQVEPRLPREHPGVANAPAPRVMGTI